jgi:hypothetical protein
MVFILLLAVRVYMGLFERLIFIVMRNGKDHRLYAGSRPQNRYAPQNDPQIAKEELGPFLTILGTHMRAS